MTHLSPEQAPWMRGKDVRAVIAALAADGGEVRFVGGAVRNALLGRPVKDVDIATPLTPDKVIRRLTDSGIKAVPTGIEHGTVTALAGAQSFEVTTLRSDIETDGRHAVIAFTNDWRQDAARRDFTINALYASPDGEIFDYHEGLQDIAARRVRFIGDPRARIREDFLRTLRRFRFHAWYGKGDIDAAALKAAVEERQNLSRLSGERIAQEFLRLLEAENPLSVLHVMMATGILAEIIPDMPSMLRLDRLCAIDAANFFAPDPVLRLAALIPMKEAAERIAGRFKLSNKDRDRIVDLAEAREQIVSYLSIREVRKLLYRLGKERFRDRVFLRWAEDAHASSAIQWRAMLAFADAWERPVFPLSGHDVIKAGVPEGPQVGHILSQVEAWWIDADFTDDRLSIAERLKAVVLAAPR